MNDNLNVYEMLNEVKSNDYVRIKHNCDAECIQTNGVIRKIDKQSKLLYVLDSKISFDDIVDIKKCCNNS